MKISKLILLILLSVPISARLLAQSPYTLKQCIDSALKNNLNIQSAGFDLKKAEEQKKEAVASFLPQVSATGQYQYYTKVPSQLIPSSLFGGGNNAPKYVTGSFNLAQSTQANAKLDQTLYNGQFLIALKAAKANTNIYTVQLKSSKEDVAYNVGATYYNIQSLTKKVDLFTDNLANSDKLINAMKLKLDNGIATKTDYNRLLVSRESINASLISTRGQLQQQLVQLKFLMGKSLSDSLAVEVDAGQNSLPALLANESGNSSKRTDIQLLQAQKVVGELEKLNIKAGYQPTLSFTTSYGTTGYNDKFQPFSNINGKWFNSSSIGLNLSIPIYDGGKKRSQIRQKNIELQQYDTKIQLYKQQADKEIATAVISYNTNVVTLQSQYSNVQLANKIYLDRQLQFQNGIVSLKDVLDAKNDLIDAQNTFISALVNTRTAELDLKKAKGELLDITNN
ncbi:TolC family protein [Mucilaginibacter sp. UC70_90]